ncbi:Glutathione S-transferase [Pseudovibrio sp. FO-BEG1]|uniref:glutathione S-transferase family protein n=1 Tax=unclassified Pseudovibrio TaxID=2627060 RepID=UPI000186B64B|nr:MULTISPECIES: glutathione S-transferase family protein [unclassified Pseudovibrio]AEV35626.1 Glutathione S-transferase [Pseudovibrio sp. FO-BEG1]EEA92361.1 maleylacetoacetate isomerase, putative [Pseudovibrio sp. JE062]
MIQFFAYPESVFCAKVRIALDMKELDYAEVPPPDGYGSTAYKKIVPAGSIPGLKDESAALSDSNAILEYLEETAPSPALLPEHPVERAQVRALMGLHDTRIEPSVRAFYAPIKAGKSPGDEIYKQLIEDMSAAFERLEDMIEAAPYAVGHHVTLAECAFATTFSQAQQLASLFGGELKLKPKCQRWWQAMQSLSHAATSIDINRKAMQDWVAKFIQVDA